MNIGQFTQQKFLPTTFSSFLFSDRSDVSGAVGASAFVEEVHATILS